MNKVLHKNSQKRFVEENTIYFVTANTFNKFPFFEEEIFCKLWIEELKLCKQLKQFELYAFCLNYDHFHIVLKPGGKFDISKIMQSFKRNFSRDVNKIIFNEKIKINCYLGDNMDCRLQDNGDDISTSLQSLHEGADPYPRREPALTSRLQRGVFKNLQECDTSTCRLQGDWNKMFDENIVKSLKTKFHKKYPNPNIPQFKWQKSFHDHVIRNAKDLIEHLGYTATNFHKHDLPNDWKYTSLNFHDLIDLIN